MKTVVARWEGALRFSTRPGSGTEVIVEGTEGVEGSRPTELLLGALAACTGMDVISICLKKRQAIDRYTVQASGRQREVHPESFEEIDVEHSFDGDRVDAEAVRRAIQLSATRYCPVSANLATGDVTIRHTYVIRRTSGEERREVVTIGPRGAGLDPLTVEGRESPVQEPRAPEPAGTGATGSPPERGRGRSSGPT